MAVEVAENLQLDEVRLIPVNQPGHRSGRSLPRTKIRDDIISTKAPLVLDDIELQRGGTALRLIR